MKTHCRWALLPLLLFVSLSAWGYPPMGYGHPPPKPALGVRVADLPFQELDRLNLEYGVRVVDVAPGAPAADAGLKPGDVLLGLDGKAVYSSARLRWLVSGLEPGRDVDLEIYRSGERDTLQARIDAPRPPQALTPAPAMPPGGAFLGVYPQEMTDELREAFGAEGGKGVLVARVLEDSPAERAGIKAGDIIVRMNGKTLERVDDLYRAVAFFDPREEITVNIVRRGEPVELKATLGERERPAGANTAQDAPWYDPEALRRMLPPPEYWRRMMDEMMRSLEESWEDLRREDPPVDKRDYY